MAEYPLRRLGIAFLVVAIVVLLATSTLISMGSDSQSFKTGTLAPGNYTENLSMYLTATETLWKVNLSGGNISVNSVSVPQSVSGYSITLTHYSLWYTQFEIFTQHGFGLLGPSEPYPDGALLVINTSSSSDATQLANSLGQAFGLAFEQISSSPNGFAFFSPISFSTEINAYFWKLVPTSAGGFASMFSQTQLESNDLNYYQLSYSSSTSTYSISMGGLMPLSSTNFSLYTQLNLPSSAYNYSSVAQSSTLDIHVLGGLFNNASAPFVNHSSNFSASIDLNLRSGSGSNNTIPNVNAGLDFSFPTILAYRQITPSLTPSQSGNVSVTIYVDNVSPVVAPTAEDVFVNDSWIYSQQSNFKLTVSQTSGSQNLAPGQNMTIAYAFTVLASNGTFNIPETPVTYHFVVGNQTVNGEAFLNPETIVVGGANAPLLEATETLSASTLQAGRYFSVGVTISNKGSGAAFNLKSDGLTKQNLPAGSSWTYTANGTSGSLTQTNALVSYGVSWQDASGITHNTTTNTVNAAVSFAAPGSPALMLYKSINSTNPNSMNVTLTVFNNGLDKESNISVIDPVPTNIGFVKSYNGTSSLRFSNGNVNINLSSIAAQTNETFVYLLNATNPSENYVFLPASVSTVWNNMTIVHSSVGEGLPLGVVATKVFSPTQGFPGSNVTVSIGLVNRGSLPIYNVRLNNTFDSFLKFQSTNSGSQAVLGSGQRVNATLKATFTGLPGAYSSSPAAASFIFAGTNMTASSSVFGVTIYQLPSASINYSALKVEENHDINITIVVTNPSNVTVSNLNYTLTIPKGLNVLYGGDSNFTIQSLGPNSTETHTFFIITNQPNVYSFNGTLFFNYHGQVLGGVANSLLLNIGDDITIRYVIPVVVGLAIVIFTLLYVRRLTKKTP